MKGWRDPEWPGPGAAAAFFERNDWVAGKLSCRPGLKSVVASLEVLAGRSFDKGNWKLQKNEVCFNGYPSTRRQNWAGRDDCETWCKGLNGKMLEKMLQGSLSCFCWIKYVCLKIPFQKVFSVACYVIKDENSEPESLALGEVLKVCVTYKRFHRTSASFRPLVNAIPFQ